MCWVFTGFESVWPKSHPGSAGQTGVLGTWGNHINRVKGLNGRIHTEPKCRMSGSCPSIIPLSSSPHTSLMQRKTGLGNLSTNIHWQHLERKMALRVVSFLSLFLFFFFLQWGSLLEGNRKGFWHRHRKRGKEITPIVTLSRVLYTF